MYILPQLKTKKTNQQPKWNVIVLQLSILAGPWDGNQAVLKNDTYKM
jgi:hypothetical protein